MTAIHLPPGSPSGQSLDTATLRAQVSANKLAALMPSASPNGATVSQSDGTAPQGADVTLRPSQQGQLPSPPPGGSTRESLSFAARTILSLLGQGDSGPLRSAGPLLPVPPTRLSNGASQTQQALVHLVHDSGLFYESHLAQWIAGRRGLASMAREPQAGIGRDAYPDTRGAPPGGAAPYGGPPGAATRPSAAGPMPGMPPAPTGAMPDPGAVIDVVTTSTAAPATTMAALIAADAEAAAQADSRGSGENADGPSPPQRDATARNAEPPRGPDMPRMQQAGAQLYQAAANEAARSATSQSMLNAAAELDASARPEAAMGRGDAAPAIHPNTEGIVRQQLELLATHQFRWAGEAWPGTPMQWEVTDQLPEWERQAGGEATGDEARTWSSRLLLELPQLGPVEARLTLTPSGLETRLTVQEDRAALMLGNAQDRLRTSLDARGIDLLHFSVQRDGTGDGKGGGA